LAVLLLALLACPSVATAAGIFRVDAASTAPTPDGQSWATAFPGIQAAVDAAFGAGGGEVWVKEGTYTSTTDPVVTMQANVHLYGGFAGGETSRAERDWGAHVTAIDGENARCCVVGADDATLDGFTVQNGTTSLGGGMRNASSSPTVTNCTFTANAASDRGGGMYNESSSPTVTNCTFSGNVATEYGAGMYNDSSSPAVSHCTFSENMAATNSASGGGMCNHSSSSPTVTDCTFSGNSVMFGGGGMSNSFSSPTVTNCTFADNSTDYSGGGGIKNYFCNPTVINCAFTCNDGASDGGGMLNISSSPTVTNCAFSGNTAANFGGGMRNSDSSSPTVTNCTFSENTAISYDGGGMYNSYCSPAVTNCTFSKNAAPNGGGMSNDYFSSPWVTNCTFSGNAASQDGGGMYNSYESSPTVMHCTLSGNTATDYGGGMRNYASSRPTLINCTISENAALNGGGIFHSGDCTPTLINCIIWGHSNGAFVNPATVTYSCIEGGYAGVGNIDLDPLLGSLGNHGGAVDTYPIGTFSPARDSGVRCFLDVGGTLFYEIPGGGGYATADGASYVPSSTENELTTTDARGVPRPEGPGIDMGAHEFVPGAEGELLVISPNGGEQWGCGTTQTITWENALGDAGPTVRLGLEKGGEFVDWIVRQTDNDGLYNWIVWTDLVPADDYAVRVQSYTNNTYRDLSNAPFSILPLTVRVPNGGEIWTMGNVYVVDWVGNPTAIGADVRVGLHFGTDFLYWINRQAAHDGQYFWKVPTDLAAGYGYRIRVQSYGDATIKDLSDAPFTLELPTLLWTSPDFHDELTAGQTYAVTWVCNDMDAVGSDVRIALHKGGAFIDWMTRKTENDGAWDWTVPVGLSPAPSYRLRLQSYTDKNLRAMSPAFTIVVP